MHFEGSFSMEEIKLFVSDFLRLFMMSFKYGLILLRYFSTDSILFLSPLLSYSIQLILQKLLTLTGLL